MTADSSQSHQSIDGANSPQNRKSFPSPWAQIVRGESESTVSAVVNQAPPPSTSPSSSATEQSNFSDCSPVMVASSPFEIPVAAAAECAVGNDENAGRPNKPAWKKPLDGVSEVSPVMGAVSWPALSDSTKFSPKSSPSADYSPKIVVSDGSVPSPKVHFGVFTVVRFVYLCLIRDSCMCFSLLFYQLFISSPLNLTKNLLTVVNEL